MKELIQKWRHFLLYGALFSLFINLLQLTFSVYMLQIYDRVLSSYSLPTLAVITVAAVASLVVEAALEFVRSRLLVRCGVDIDQTLSHKVMQDILKQTSLPGQRPTATLRDVNALRNFFAGSAIFTLFDIPWTPLLLAIIYFLHPLLGLVATGGGVVLIVLALLNEKVSRRPIEMANQVNASSMNFMAIATRNAELVNGMGMISDLTRHWDRMNDMVIDLQTRASRKAGLIQSLSSFVRQSMQVFIYGVGAYLTIKQETTAGCMIASSIIMGRALSPIQMGIAVWKNMIEAREAYQRLDTLFAEAGAAPPTMELPEPKGLLAAEHATVLLQNRPILRDVSFSIQPGESLGLIGPSGAGKSTLCRLLLGIWPPTGGKVRLDGFDIFAWDQQRLGRFIGYLPQDIELFDGTISANIARFSDIDAEKVIFAAKMAGVHELVLGMAAGYDTRIGPGGVMLSGGQRQRVGLARALYGNPRLLVLDEPNSNLDDLGEKALLLALEQLRAMGTTVVMVSHKPSLLAGVDKILLLREGQVALFGPRQAVFQQLMGGAQAAPPVVREAKDGR
jgi:PrtD family type I secretion system ABC transporter